MNTCKTCLYWNDRGDFLDGPVMIPATLKKGETREVRLGVCRCHTPLSGGFPSVREDDWCGEFRPLLQDEAPPVETGYPTEHGWYGKTPECPNCGVCTLTYGGRGKDGSQELECVACHKRYSFEEVARLLAPEDPDVYPPDLPRS